MTGLTDTLKLTVHFAERERTGGRYLADALLDLYAQRGVATSIMLRGISSFGPRNIVRTDESLSMSEDLPALVSAVDAPAAIEALVDDVAALTQRGLITLERARSVGGALPALDHTVKLTLYLGRQQRFQGRPGYQAACEVFHTLGFASATTFLGVDGTIAGQRRRAQFFSRNVDVPTMVTAIGTPQQAIACRDRLAEMFDDPLLTLERAQLCKRDGLVYDRPQPAPGYQKLTVLTSEDSRYQGVAIHRALVRELRESHAVSGATALRGLWGFHGDHRPHGDRMLRLSRGVPVATLVVDTPEAISRAFDIAGELTDGHGQVICETVPALLALDHGHRRGDLRLR
jgi:PII-like signaling protein